jgi:hypothetical protein
MTAIYYPDLVKISENQRFRLEAISAHNGTIPHLDGKWPEPDEFEFEYRQHQNGFRYRLVDDRDNVLWERWQGEDEDSPHELLVSDQGWSIVRTHGFAPEIIVVKPGGGDALNIDLLGVENVNPRWGLSEPRRLHFWRLSRMGYSTAGSYWSENSWPHFFQVGDRPFFCWRAWWGQRLVIDLGASRIWTEPEALDPSIAEALAFSEIDGVRKLLDEFSKKFDEVRDFIDSGYDKSKRIPLMEKLPMVVGALHLVGVHQIKECVPILREWESLDCPEHPNLTSSMEGHWMGHQHFRRIVQQVLRRLDEVPVGSSYYVVKEPRQAPLPFPGNVTDRYQKIRAIEDSMTADQILNTIGLPDFVDRWPNPDEKPVRWTEVWDYDFRLDQGWVTTRITWQAVRKKVWISAIVEAPSDWLNSDDREREILR